jgi:type IV secretory pathway VirB10-like protein
MTRTPLRPVATRLRMGRILFVAAIALLGCITLGAWLISKRAKPVAPASGESGTSPGWTAAQLHYEVAPPKPETPKPEPVDTISPQLAALRAMMLQMQAELEALKNRKPPPPPQPKPVSGKPPPAKMIFVSHDVKDRPPVSKETLYTLAPGATKLPCEIETVVNSDVEGYFTAKVTTNVYDTETGRHLLVPQGSTILGHDQSKSLIYGDTRMDTMSLTLTLPSGKDVDLGRAPVTDQLGVAGLTGEVNNHFWRLFGAVFIGGALRGGMVAMQTAVTSAAGAGQVASGIGSLGNQATTTVIQPFINTRPTIVVASGQLCHVLLIKPLHLAAQWQ